MTRREYAIRAYSILNTLNCNIASLQTCSERSATGFQHALAEVSVRQPDLLS
jgi:hypothetical protein